MEIRFKIQSRDIEKIDKEVQKIVRDITDKIFQYSQEELTKTKIVDGISRATSDESNLLKSGKALHSGNNHKIVYDAPYASAVEYGTSPHWMPIKPLLGWARRRLKNEKLAYPIQKKIAKKGTPPQPYLRPAMDRVINEGVKWEIYTKEI